MERLTWDEYFMLMAKLVALRSTCNKRKVGCVLVKNKRIIATGYNGSLSGLQHCSDNSQFFCFKKVMKDEYQDNYDYCRAVHAEANAIAQASKLGISTIGAIAYITLAPCYNCFKLLISAGITEIYYEEIYEKDRLDFYKQIADFCGVKFKQIKISPEKIEKFIEELFLPISRKRI